VEGGVPLKYKFLLAMALDAANGSVGGVNKIPRCSGDTGRGNKRRNYAGNQDNPVHFWSWKRLYSFRSS